MDAASASSPSSSLPLEPKLHFLKQIRSHEIAIGELSNLPTSRALPGRSYCASHFVQCLRFLPDLVQSVYKKNGNLFFRTTIEKATASEQKQLNSVKAKLQKLNSP